MAHAGDCIRRHVKKALDLGASHILKEFLDVGWFELPALRLGKLFVIRFIVENRRIAQTRYFGQKAAVASPIKDVQAGQLFAFPVDILLGVPSRTMSKNQQFL